MTSKKKKTNSYYQSETKKDLEILIGDLHLLLLFEDLAHPLKLLTLYLIKGFPHVKSDLN